MHQLGGRSLPGLLPPSVVNNPFFNWIQCGGVGGLPLALLLVWVVWDSIMVTYYGSTLGGGWVLCCFCYTILVYVSVISSLVFDVICTWKMSASFLSASIHSVPKVTNRAIGDGFFSELIKSVSSWASSLAEEIPGIIMFSGNSYTVSAMHSDLVL